MNHDQRLPGESASAYAAYREYRDLGPGRTLNAAWQAHRQGSWENKPSRGRPPLKNDQTRPPSRQWTTGGSQWKWAVRTADYDAQIDVVERRAGREGIR